MKGMGRFLGGNVRLEKMPFFVLVGKSKTLTETAN